MTDWKEMVRGEELESAAKERKKSTTKVSNIKPEYVSQIEDEGFHTVSISQKNRYTMEKDKPFDEIFENEVWMVFYKMGFSIMNRDNSFKVELNGNTKQIDVLAIDGETCIIVECKASKTFEKTADFKKEIESIHGYYPELIKILKKEYGKNLKFKYIFATKNYLIQDDSKEAERMSAYNIAYFDYDTVDYYDKLTDHLGTAARYQLLGNLFPGQEVKELDTKVPAIKGSMGGLDYYTFLIEPEKLLKLSYVLHRNKANHLLMPTYQRLIKKERLKAVRNFVNEGGFFPNSLVVSIDEKKVKFEQASQSSDTDSKMGMLYLPNKYKSIYVIDGQHRLYGYSDTKYSDNNVIPVVAFINLEAEKQVQMFMEINENQKSVSKSLRNTLNSDLLWNSNDPKKRKEALMIKIAEALGERKDSPLYERVVTGEDSNTTRRCISTEYLKKAIKASSFLNEYDKNGISKQGTLDRNDNDETLKRVLKYLIYCYGVVEKGCKEEWEKDGDGCLAINNTSQALIRIFNDILEIVLNDLGQNVVGDIDDICEKCKPMLNTLVEVINSMSTEELEKIKKLRGAAAEKEAWRCLQLPMNSRDPHFINVDLQNYIDNNCLDNIDEATNYLNTIEQHFVNTLREDIEPYPNWLTKRVPTNLGIELSQKKAAENYIRDVEKKPSIDIWDIMSFDDIMKISKYSTNWTDFSQANFATPSYPKPTQKTVQTWLINLSSYKRKVKDNKSLSKKEFEDLEEIFVEFMGGIDANH